MKKILLVIIMLFAVGCKSVKQTKNNKLDVTSVKSENIENNFSFSEIELDTKEIVLISADPKEEITITDKKVKNNVLAT